MLIHRQSLSLLFLSLALAACGARTTQDSPPPPADPDASVTSDVGPEDGGGPPSPPAIDAAASSPGTTRPVSIDHHPMAHCPSSSRDTLYLNVVGDVRGLVSGDDYSAGHATFTNLDSNWTVEAPFEFFVHRVSGEGEVLEIATVDGGGLAPGHYVLGSASAPALSLGLGYWYDQCAAASGTLDVVESQFDTDDAGAPLPSSTLLSFDIQCANDSGPTVPIEGCLRYASSPDEDAGVPASAVAEDGGDDGGDVLAPCASGGNVFYIDGSGYNGNITGPMSITGDTSTWSAGIDFTPSPLLQFGTTMWPLWELDFGADSIAPGTYTLSGAYNDNPWANVLANSGGCGAATGTVTIASIETSAASNGAPGLNVTQLLMGFNETCANGALVWGCVSFGGR